MRLPPSGGRRQVSPFVLPTPIFGEAHGAFHKQLCERLEMSKRNIRGRLWDHPRGDNMEGGGP